MGSLPRERFRLVKSSSLITGEVVGNEAGMAVRIALGLRAAPVGGREALLDSVCLRTRSITNDC